MIKGLRKQLFPPSDYVDKEIEKDSKKQELRNAYWLLRGCGFLLECDSLDELEETINKNSENNLLMGRDKVTQAVWSLSWINESDIEWLPLPAEVKKQIWEKVSFIRPTAEQSLYEKLNIKAADLPKPGDKFNPNKIHQYRGTEIMLKGSDPDLKEKIRNIANDLISHGDGSYTTATGRTITDPAELRAGDLDKVVASIIRQSGVRDPDKDTPEIAKQISEKPELRYAHVETYSYRSDL